MACAWAGSDAGRGSLQRRVDGEGVLVELQLAALALGVDGLLHQRFEALQGLPGVNLPVIVGLRPTPAARSPMESR